MKSVYSCKMISFSSPSLRCSSTQHLEFVCLYTYSTQFFAYALFLKCSTITSEMNFLLYAPFWISFLYLRKKFSSNGDNMYHLMQWSIKREKFCVLNVLGNLGTRRCGYLALGLNTARTSWNQLNMYGLYNNKINIQAEYVRTMAVTAHRGASRNYPENTMAAFKGAKKLGAGWIELDVQQSRDGMIFVMHDTNFKRTTGVNKNTWEMDYKEISRLDAGSFFNSSFAGEKVPLLSEVIAFAKKNKIKLNIELKPSGHEREFEQKVADIIEAEDFYNNCVITSQVYEVLENVKAYNENIQTVYVMSLAYGDINQLKAADHFSIEATSITEKIVSDVHNAGKEIYAWTVNTEESINNMIILNVDNIITDDITLAKECIFLSKTGDVIAEYIKIVTE